MSGRAQSRPNQPLDCARGDKSLIKKKAEIPAFAGINYETLG